MHHISHEATETEKTQPYYVPARTYVQEKKKRNHTLALLAVVVVLVLGAAAAIMFWPGNNNPIYKDSGVAACEQMAENAKKPSSNSSKTPMTQKQLDEKKVPFTKSKYADIKVSGTNILDTVYKADHMDVNAGLGDTMALLTLMQSQWTQLQIACSNHGVDLPALKTTK